MLCLYDLGYDLEAMMKHNDNWFEYSIWKTLNLLYILDCIKAKKWRKMNSSRVISLSGLKILHSHPSDLILLII